MDRFGLSYKERLRHFGWLRWVAGINVVIMVVDEEVIDENKTHHQKKL